MTRAGWTLLALLAVGCADAPPIEAWVYPVSPAEGELARVELLHLDSAEGLSGRHVSVLNCVDEPGGERLQLTLGQLKLDGRLCVLTRKAAPGPDGYLHVQPPASDTDGGDPFAEVMVYHHLTTIAERFRTRLGAALPAKPLKAIVNLQGYADLLGRWIGVPNAAYAPPSAQHELRDLIDIDLLHGEEAILFGYNNLFPQLGQVDFAYDASIIYHEYAHYAVGDRLQQPAPDAHGLDTTPRAVNEALADYFACSALGAPRVGSYILGDGARDLTVLRRCPDDLVGESHRDGQILSGALWAARELLGAETTDRAVWRALQTFGRDTTLDRAAAAILHELRDAAADPAAVQALFDARGLVGCQRIRDHQDWVTGPDALYPPEIPGTASAPAVFKSGVPAAVQQRLTLDPDTRSVVITIEAIGGTVLGMGGEPADLAVALHRDGPIVYDHASGTGSSDAAVVAGAVSGAARKIVLGGACATAGQLVFQLVNRGPRPVLVNRLQVTQSPDPPPAGAFDGC